MLRTIGNAVAAFVLTCAALAQADFSAEIANLSAANNTFHTRIFSTKNKLRFQGEDKAGRTNSIMIVNLAEGTHTVLLPQQKKYVVNKGSQIPGQGVTFFQFKDVESACGEWQRLMQAAAVEDEDSPKAPTGNDKCQKIGHEAVNDRDTVKYEDKAAKGEASLMWVDVKLHFPVKWKNAVASGELRNIKEEAQPAELFTIPAGYTTRPFDIHQKAKPAQ